MKPPISTVAIPNPMVFNIERPNPRSKMAIYASNVKSTGKNAFQEKGYAYSNVFSRGVNEAENAHSSGTTAITAIMVKTMNFTAPKIDFLEIDIMAWNPLFLTICS
jgi:hypothetical protein